MTGPSEKQFTTNHKLVTIRGLNVVYETRQGNVDALSDVDLDIYRGEFLGLVGESGCGKSTLGRAILRIVAPPGRIVSGELIFDQTNLLELNEEEMDDIRGRRISMIFQDPATSLNPVQRVGDHIIETIQAHEPKVKRRNARERAAELLDRLGISRERLDDYPHQMSGGMRQRVMIGIAMALSADLIIADEPTTSLDVIVEAQFLDLLRELRSSFDLTIMLVTHNIGVVAELADRVAVMYAGRIIEVAPAQELFDNPKHPYTQGLLRCVPNIKATDDALHKMKGMPPSLMDPPLGCRFHPRCPEVMPICSRVVPPTFQIAAQHTSDCWLHASPSEISRAERGEAVK
ncbi:MAG: ABC transporter ATP-binding protein [Anaerolineales bacterium]|jgi:oligopeptide/dipeptide ABC transporter ATP-binding protein